MLHCLFHFCVGLPEVTNITIYEPKTLKWPAFGAEYIHKWNKVFSGINRDMARFYRIPYLQLFCSQLSPDIFMSENLVSQVFRSLIDSLWKSVLLRRICSYHLILGTTSIQVWIELSWHVFTTAFSLKYLTYTPGMGLSNFGKFFMSFGFFWFISNWIN